MGGTRAPRGGHLRPDGDVARAIGEAMLLAVGEVGYASATIEDALERSGHSTQLFHRFFEGKADCYASAFALAAEDVCRVIVERGRSAPGWVDGVRRALAELLDLVEAEPLVAKALFVEVYVAGGDSVRRREQFLDRLGSLVDAARRDPACPPRPPRTASLVVASIDWTIAAALVEPGAEPGASLLPKLLHIAVLHYFGEDAAWEAVSRLRS